MRVCDETCDIFPCPLAEPGETCELELRPRRLQVMIRNFYGGKEQFEHELRNMAVHAYLQALKSIEDRPEVFMRAMHEVAYLYNVLFSGNETEIKDIGVMDILKRLEEYDRRDNEETEE